MNKSLRDSVQGLEDSISDKEAHEESNSRGGLKLRLIHTPTDMRGALGSLAHAVNWLLPPDPEIEKKARHAVEAITADLWAIGPNDHDMVPSYLDAVEEPLSELKACGLGLSFAVLTEPTKVNGYLMEEWSTTIFVVSERPLVFVSVEGDVQSPLHLLNACKATERNLIRCDGDGVGVFPKAGFNLSWFDQEPSWCPTCWKVVAEQRNQLKIEFGGNEQLANDSANDYAKELLLIQAMIAPVMGVTEDAFEDHLNEFTIGEDSKREILDTYSKFAAMVPAKDRSLEASLKMIQLGETDLVEFKSTFAVPLEFDRAHWESKGLSSQSIDQKYVESEKGVIHSVLKTITAFINSQGGTLFLGVSDGGKVLGLQPDYRKNPKKPNADGLELTIRAMLKDRIDPVPHSLVEFQLLTQETNEFFRIDVKPDFDPHHLDQNQVFIRDGNQTVQLTGPSLTKWIAKRIDQKRSLQ